LYVRSHLVCAVAKAGKARFLRFGLLRFRLLSSTVLLLPLPSLRLLFFFLGLGFLFLMLFLLCCLACLFGLLGYLAAPPLPPPPLRTLPIIAATTMANKRKPTMPRHPKL